MTFIPKTPDWRLLPTELRERLYETLRSRSRLAAFTKLTPIEMAARFGFSDLIRDGQVTLHRIEQQLSQDEVTTPCEEEHPEAMARWKDQTSAPRLSFAHHGFTLANDMRRREYSDKEIAHALAVLKSNGGNVWRSSAELGIPYQTLRTWKRGKGKRLQTADVTQLHKEKELSLAAGCEKVLWKLLKYGLDPKKLKEANAAALATCFGIFTDKMRILRDQGPPPSEAAKSAAESIKQAAAALVELSKGTGEPLDLVSAEARIRDIQLQSAQLASERTQ